MWHLLGVLALASVAVGALVFHLGWRSRHAGARWPAKVIVSFGSGVVAAGALVVGSWFLGFVAVALYILARFMPLSSSE